MFIGIFEPNLLDLTWEERHPFNYCIGPTQEDVEWLKAEIKRDEEKIKKSKIKRRL